MHLVVVVVAALVLKGMEAMAQAGPVRCIMDRVEVAEVGVLVGTVPTLIKVAIMVEPLGRIFLESDGIRRASPVDHLFRFMEKPMAALALFASSGALDALILLTQRTFNR